MMYIGGTGTIYNAEPKHFAKGGEGFLYRLKSDPSHVLKIFSDASNTAEKQQKISYMVSNQVKKNNNVAWPEELIYEYKNGQKGKFVGYKMLFVPNCIPVNTFADRDYDFSYKGKLIIAQNLCVAIGSVHDANQVCGDLQPANVLVNPKTGTVTLVDTDSYHLTYATGNRLKTYRCVKAVKEYVAPEIQRKLHQNKWNYETAPYSVFTKESDLFALAVHIFSILMCSHPFACAIENVNHLQSIVALQPADNIYNGYFPFYIKKPGYKQPVYASKFSTLPVAIQTLFVRTFVNGDKNPQCRPTAQEWYDALGNFEMDLAYCENHHYFASHLNKCPFCHKPNLQKVQQATINPSFTEPKTKKQPQQDSSVKHSETVSKENSNITSKENSNTTFLEQLLTFSNIICCAAMTGIIYLLYPVCDTTAMKLFANYAKANTEHTLAHLIYHTGWYANAVVAILIFVIMKKYYIQKNKNINSNKLTCIQGLISMFLSMLLFAPIMAIFDFLFVYPAETIVIGLLLGVFSFPFIYILWENIRDAFY